MSIRIKQANCPNYYVEYIIKASVVDISCKMNTVLDGNSITMLSTLAKLEKTKEKKAYMCRMGYVLNLRYENRTGVVLDHIICVLATKCNSDLKAYSLFNKPFYWLHLSYWRRMHACSIKNWAENKHDVYFHSYLLLSHNTNTEQ